MPHKRTKKDVADAYYRGFQAGFNVRPNPVAMILRAMWKKHELKKMKLAYLEAVKEENKREYVREVLDSSLRVDKDARS